MSRALAIVLLSTLSGAGCYTYTPISPVSVTPDMTIRVDLRSGAVQDRVEGRVFEVGQRSLALLPEAGPGQDTSPRTLLLTDVQSIDVRRFNSTRTMLVVGGGVAMGIGALFLADSNPGDTRGPGGGGDFSILPYLRVLLGSD